MADAAAAGDGLAMYLLIDYPGRLPSNPSGRVLATCTGNGLSTSGTTREAQRIQAAQQGNT